MSAISHNYPNNSIDDFRNRYWLSRLAIAVTVGMYFLAGVGALAVSFNLHSKVIRDMLGEVGFVPYAIAASIEGFKLCTIVVYDYLRRKALLSGTVSTTRRVLDTVLVRFFQLTLFSLSLVCTTTFVAQKFDRPQLAAVQNQDITELKSNYERKLGELKTRQAQEKTDLTGRDSETRQRIESEYQPLIQEERQGIRIERSHEGRHGRVIGGRYESHQQMLDTYNSSRQSKLEVHDKKTDGERKELETRHEEEIRTLNNWFDQEQTSIRHNPYRDDHRVEHRSIAANIAVINQVLGWPVSPLSFVAVFALMLSSVLELGIFLAFSAFAKVAFPQDVLFVEQYLGETQKKTSPIG